MRLPLISRNFFGAKGLLLSLIAVAPRLSLCDLKQEPSDNMYVRPDSESRATSFRAHYCRFGGVLFKHQDKRNHDKAQHTNEPRHVDVRQHIGLGDDGVVYAQGSLSRCLRLAETAMKEVRAQAARHVAISLSRACHMHAKYVLMELRAACDHGLDQGNTHARTHVAQQIDRSGDFSALLFRDARI